MQGRIDDPAWGDYLVPERHGSSYLAHLSFAEGQALVASILIPAAPEGWVRYPIYAPAQQQEPRRPGFGR